VSGESEETLVSVRTTLVTLGAVWSALLAPAFARAQEQTAPAQPQDDAHAGGAPGNNDANTDAQEKRIQELEAAVKALQSQERGVQSATKASVTVSGYVEAFWQWNFNEPSNFITNYRGFDDRHNIFAIDNAVLDVSGKYDRVSARVALQVGITPEAYYSAEPVWRATAGAGASGPDVWKFIQQANVGYLAPLGRGLQLDAGVFLSPIGPESIAVKDNFNWSRSNLFFGLPFYHSGVRATYPLTDRLSAELMLTNGWNSVIDDNIQLSFEGHVTYTVPDKLTFQVLYFGGVERPQNAPEGAPWRNLFDAYATYSPTKWLSAILHGDAGYEPNNFGTSGWAAGAASLRVQPLSWLYLSARTDRFREWIASNALGTATPLFWGGSRWVASQTATIDVRPNDNMSVRLEYRHDQSEQPIYFAGNVTVDANGNFVTNARGQDTIMVGATAWF
jgi:hypothetical protein